MGQVVRWMREQGVEVWGERGMEGHMEGDVLLCELVRTAERRQEVLDACVLADVHWVGQVVREVGGTWLVDEVAAAKLRGVPGGGQVWSMLQRPLGVSGRQGRQSCRGGEVVRSACLRARLRAPAPALGPVAEVDWREGGGVREWVGGITECRCDAHKSQPGCGAGRRGAGSAGEMPVEDGSGDLWVHSDG